MTDDNGFDVAMERVFRWEGGYANNPLDPGGETNFGISKAAYPDLDIRNLTREDARAIYERDYWQKPGISTLPNTIAGAVFDLGVNVGPREAIILLQLAVGAVETRITADGVIGRQTRTAVALAPPAALIAEFRYQACMHYLAVVSSRPSSSAFLKGWLRRACALA